MRSVLLSLFAVALSAPAAAQGPTSPEDIVVTGPRTEEAVRNFVDQLGAPVGDDSQHARWDHRLCPGVTGLRAQYAQLLIDRIAQRAFDVGLDVGEPGCRANVLIIISERPDDAAEDLFDHHRDALGYYDEHGQTSLGRAALRQFVSSDAPVRWWHVTRAHTQSGEAVRRHAQAPRNPNSPLNAGAPLIFRFGGASHLSETYRQDIGAAFIIVDAARVADIGLDFTALADYLAMVALAQVDPAADTRELATILNLFTDGAPRELTAWDVSYLRGVYAADREDSGIRQQGQIARNMREDLVDE